MTQLLNTSLFNDASLRAYYRFENNLNDSTPNGYNLTAVSPSYVTGHYGQALDAGGSPSISNNLGITNLAATGISIAGWFKTTSTPNVNTSFFEQRNNSTQQTVVMTFLYNAGNPIIRFLFNSPGNGSQQNVDYSYTWTADSLWHHVAFTLSSGGSEITYFDAKQVASGNITIRNGSSGNGDNFYVQNDDSNPGAHFFMADDISVFNRVLTPTEIFTLGTDNNAGILAFLI